ncbi:hypothetical protein [Oryza sativa Japonica Group]|uniref:Uncharacterized protein n=1 Tax=Oryza sativa subsp. japonica TaxID=39947 RepID=Q5JLL1_ORYSJ|nr:hypothetical protein [Oryza sativa Japonica Group]
MTPDSPYADRGHSATAFASLTVREVEGEGWEEEEKGKEKHMLPSARVLLARVM